MLSITSIDDMIRCIEDLRLESRSMMMAELDRALPEIAAFVKGEMRLGE